MTWYVYSSRKEISAAPHKPIKLGFIKSASSNPSSLISQAKKKYPRATEDGLIVSEFKSLHSMQYNNWSINGYYFSSPKSTAKPVYFDDDGVGGLYA